MIRATAVYRDELCRAKFTYNVEPFNLLHWRSHLDEVKTGTPWRGPCGDLTATVMDALTTEKFGISANLIDCARIIVAIDRSVEPDHIVGAIKTEDDGWLIVGDTNRKPYTAHGMTYKAFEYNLLSEAGMKPIWRAGVPW